ncbi:hypothetical protein [Spirosoma flavum]|uniref:TonB C-terminal domain-containing protein n=1 Tax=Spirosoma flavum TaxID=2048557 RepID=A0ABW6AEH0_9BACT
MNYLILLILLLNLCPAPAQLTQDDLSQDPVFTTVLARRLKYPRQAQWSSIYVRLFAEFTVDQKGHVQLISILNHSNEGVYFGLEPTVINALKRLPPLSLHYSGHYILPVSFQLQDYQRKNNLLVPKDSLYLTDLAGRVILKEIKVVGSTINSQRRVGSAVRLDVNQ